MKIEVIKKNINVPSRKMVRYDFSTGDESLDLYIFINDDETPKMKEWLREHGCIEVQKRWLIWQFPNEQTKTLFLLTWEQ